MLIEKKIWPESFQSIYDGKKTFDVRLSDFVCEPGDILLLREWDPKKKDYTGRQIKKRVSYISKTNKLNYWTKEDIDKYGLQIIGFGPDNNRSIDR